jgi:hypothetical protein
MAANIRTIGLSGLARAVAQHDRLRDAEAERLTREAKGANSSFIEQLIASGRVDAFEARALAARAASPYCRSCRFPAKSSVVSCVGGKATEIAEQAYIEGVRGLRQAGLPKVRQGLASLEEVMTVTNE